MKRLAWVKVSAAWTAQAKAKRLAVTCTTWTAERPSLSCTVYHPGVSATSASLVDGVRRDVVGRAVMQRFDAAQRPGDPTPDPGCSYRFTVTRGVAAAETVVNICEKGWLRSVPAGL